MDDLTSQFGAGLSLNAAEWKPRGASSSSGGSGGGGAAYGGSSSLSPPPSDLNATTVKEFIPGRGWSAAAGT